MLQAIHEWQPPRLPSPESHRFLRHQLIHAADRILLGSEKATDFTLTTCRSHVLFFIVYSCLHIRSQRRKITKWRWDLYCRKLPRSALAALPTSRGQKAATRWDVQPVVRHPHANKKACTFVVELDSIRQLRSFAVSLLDYSQQLAM